MNGRLRVFAGTEPAHLFASEDLGMHWSELPSLRSVPSVPNWSFPAPPHIGHVKHINFDPDNPTTTPSSVEVGGLLVALTQGKPGRIFRPLRGHPSFNDPSVEREFFICRHRAWSLHGAGPWRTLGAVDEERRRDRRLPRRLCFRPSDPKLILMTAAHDAPGTCARPISPARAFRAAKTAAEHGKSFGMACRGSLASKHRSFLSRRSGLIHGHLRRDNGRRNHLQR